MSHPVGTLASVARRDIDDAIARLAERQSRLVRRAQVLDAGGYDQLIRRRVGARRWTAVGPGVYETRPGPRGATFDLWRAVLCAGDGAVASHGSAARVHRLLSFNAGAPEVLVPHRTNQVVAGATVHRTRSLPASHRTVVEQLPLTTVARTIVDLAAHAPRRRLLGVVEEALSARRVTHDELSRCLADLSKPGRRGLVTAASVFGELGPGPPVDQSVLEARLHQLLADGGLPPLWPQLPFPGRILPTGCVDGGYLDCRVILEVDGRRWHQRIEDLRRDRDRDNDAARLGWQTLRFLWEHVVGDPMGTLATIAEVRQVRLLAVRDEGRTESVS